MSFFLRSWQNRWTHRRRHPLTSARCIIHDCSFVIYIIALFFAPPALCGFIIHDDYTIDHGYLSMIGYLDIDINGYVYSNSSATTPVNSARVVTSVHATPAVTAGGNRGEGRKAPEGDAVTALGADPSETQLMMARRRRQRKRKTTNSVAIVRFTSVMTEGEC